MKSKAKSFFEALITMTGLVVVVLMTANLRPAAWAVVRNFLTTMIPKHVPETTASPATPTIRTAIYDETHPASQLPPSANAGQ